MKQSAVTRLAVFRAAHLAILIGLMLWLAGCEPRPGKMIDRREFANGKFQVRVEVYDEGNKAHVFDRGCHIKLASAPLASAIWRQFSNAYYSRCDEVATNRVRFVNENTAYVFMQWWYGVTTNAGQSWSIWDIPGHFPEKTYYSTQLIKDVSMTSDGQGTMVLNPEGVRDKKPLTLYSQDFGVNWKTQ